MLKQKTTAGAGAPGSVSVKGAKNADALAAAKKGAAALAKLDAAMAAEKQRKIEKERDDDYRGGCACWR